MSEGGTGAPRSSSAVSSEKAVTTVATDIPADLAAVQADDELLDELFVALRGPNPSPKGDAWLMKMLRAWRDDVDTEPTPQLVDVDTALAIVRARPRRSLSGRVVDVFRRLLGGGW